MDGNKNKSPENLDLWDIAVILLPKINYPSLKLADHLPCLGITLKFN